MSTITIPVDATAVSEEDRKQTQVRVAIKAGGKVQSKTISVARGKGEVKFEVEGGRVTVAVGPESTSADDLFNKQTPTTVVSPIVSEGRPAYPVRPIIITDPIWQLWLIWCRTFTISGYVLGPDGNPVPSAEVQAFNVDWFWWWSSTSQVGTAVTDPTGHFTITFEWCCGWLPWYWWWLRYWRVDPLLVEKINPVLELNPGLRITQPKLPPALGFTEFNPQPAPPGRNRRLTSQRLFAEFNPQPDPPGRTGGRSVASTVALNPNSLAALREKLVAVLPEVPEFVRFCLWPWCPWWPWLDCDPNIIFKVTQSCGGQTNVLLDETVWQARIDIPATLNVTLTTSEDACTIPPNDGQPEGDCFLFTAACSVPASEIGLTCDFSLPIPPGGLSVLGGLAYPGSSDRPFTGVVSLYGQFGTSAQADYYELTYRPLQPCTGAPSPVPFDPVPPAAQLAFQRIYFDATLPYPNQWFYPNFPPQPRPVSGGGTATVYESRQFYEQNNPPPNWGDVMTGRSWTGNVDAIALLQTDGFFADGAYEFQVVGYTSNADGSITRIGPLDGCGLPGVAGINDNNDFAVYFDNPSGPSETNPNAAINPPLVFTVNGVDEPLPACGILSVPAGATLALSISFTASDAEGFLDEYYLTIQGGTTPPATISASPLGPPVPSGAGYLTTSTPGAELGPTYAQAVTQGAVRPHWSGGQYALVIPDALPLFPQSCAYELQLNVYKRNIVNCNTYDYYWEPAYYSFTVLFI